MNREEAFQFLRLYKTFQDTGVKIVDHDRNGVELRFPGAGQRWYRPDVAAAIAIEGFTAEDPYPKETVTVIDHTWASEEMQERDRHLDAAIDKAFSKTLTKIENNKIAEAIMTAYDPAVVGSPLFRFRVRVRRNFYQKQSSANIRLWTPAGWTLVHAKEYTEMHANREVHPGGEITLAEAKVMRRDMRDLMDVAEQITGFVFEEYREATVPETD